MPGLATTMLVGTLTIAWVTAVPHYPFRLQRENPSHLDQILAEIDAIGNRRNDFGETMLESGEEDDQLSRFLFNRQSKKLGLRHGHPPRRGMKKSKEKKHGKSKEKKHGKSKEKKHKKSKEKKHRKSKEKKHKKSKEKCGGRGSKEKYPCNTSSPTTTSTTQITTTTASMTTAPPSPSTTTTGATTTTASTTTTTTATEATTIIATTSDTPGNPNNTTIPEDFQPTTNDVETLIPFPDGVDDGFFT